MSATDPSLQPRTRAERHAAALEEMLEIGMALARKLPAQAEADDADLEGLARTFTRLSRSIRLTMVLEDQFANARPAPAASPPGAPKPWEVKGLSHAAWDRADDRNSEAYELIEKVIERESEGLDRDRLLEDLETRWDEDRDEAAFLSETPVADIVRAICQDFGLHPDWMAFKFDDFCSVEERTLRLLRLGQQGSERANSDPANLPPPRPKPPPWVS